MFKVLRVSVVALGLAAVAVLGFLARDAMDRAGGPGQRARDSQPAAAQVIELSGQKFQRWAAPREVPDLRFSDPARGPTSLREFRGRVVLLNLWATWCPPCLEEMPALDRLNARLGGDKFVVVTLALDSPAKAEAFLRQIKATTLRGYVDTQGLALSTLGVTTVPTTLLIDARGREIGRLSGAAAWDENPALDLIQSYLKEST
ncbi:MAG: TlpA disulfide reductase family protein [Stagnimonas sp.]|nr:TlpA disulfide reductase family protein [Stagnimonas sp.]